MNMDKKLTLSLNQRVIAKAKKYAKLHQTSLSKMIEAYFDSLTTEGEDDFSINITPLVESLCGVIELPKDFDYKKERGMYLSEKHQ
jgi:hypothetical protein